MIAGAIEFIEWMDHRSGGDDWEDLEDLEKIAEPLIVRTVGWVFKETDTTILLVPTYYHTHAHGGIVILKCCIINRRRLDGGKQANRSSNPAPTPTEPERAARARSG